MRIDYRQKARDCKGTEFEGVMDSLAGFPVDSEERIIVDSDSVARIKDSLNDTQKSLLQRNIGSIGGLGYARSMAREKLDIKLRSVTDSYGKPTGFKFDTIPTSISRTMYLSPREASLVYSSNGLPTHIIDKKASAVFLNGLTFRCQGIEAEKMADFTDYAIQTGFVEKCSKALTQSLVYGGSIMYPIFKYDTPYTLSESLNIVNLQELSGFLSFYGMGNKDFIADFSVFDRWNTVIVPEYSPMARDYLMARYMFIPVDGVTIDTNRASLIRWKETSYWESLYYMGWCPSDISGWIEDYYQYALMQNALPKMAMQSSLLYSYVPIDSVLLQNGTDDVKELQRIAQESIDEIDVNNAKVFNSVGELKTVERAFSGFIDIFKENRINLSASCGLPVSVVFEEAPTGLASDREEDITIKKAETVKRIYNKIQSEIRKQAVLLAYSYFGTESEEARHIKNLVVESTSHEAESTAQRANIARTFADSIQKLSIAGIAPRYGIKLLSRFFPDIPMSDKMEEDLDRSFSEIQNQEPHEGEEPREKE